MLTHPNHFGRYTADVLDNYSFCHRCYNVGYDAEHRHLEGMDKRGEPGS